MKIIEVPISQYIFNATSNPYSFDELKPMSLGPIAQKIEEAVTSNFDINNILIRGIQSGSHTSISKQDLVSKIIEVGNDIYKISGDNNNILHAAPFEKGVVNKILEAFHRYKPKCQERPQYPVDIWMILDNKDYKLIEYIHPRHGVIARDKWQRNDGSYGLIGIVIVI